MGFFSDLPIHNQLDVLKKLDFKDFVRFKQCSWKSREAAFRLRYRIPLAVKRITFDREKFTFEFNTSKKRSLSLLSGEPVRLEVERFSLVSKLDIDQRKYLEDMVERMEIRAHALRFYWFNGENNAETIDHLINLLRVEALVVHYYPSSDLLRLKELKKIREIEFHQGDMKDPDFLTLQQHTVRIDGKRVTPPAINTFLKQWMSGKRQIKELEIEPISKEHAEIFEDLYFTLLWSINTHLSSCFGHLPIETRGVKLEKIYTLTRMGDGQKLFMALGRVGGVRLVAREYEELKEIEDWIGAQNVYRYIATQECKRSKNAKKCFK